MARLLEQNSKNVPADTEPSVTVQGTVGVYCPACESTHFLRIRIRRVNNIPVRAHFRWMSPRIPMGALIVAGKALGRGKGSECGALLLARNISSKNGLLIQDSGSTDVNITLQRLRTGRRQASYVGSPPTYDERWTQQYLRQVRQYWEITTDGNRIYVGSGVRKQELRGYLPQFHVSGTSSTLRNGVLKTRITMADSHAAMKHIVCAGLSASSEWIVQSAQGNEDRAELTVWRWVRQTQRFVDQLATVDFHRREVTFSNRVQRGGKCPRCVSPHARLTGYEASNLIVSPRCRCTECFADFAVFG